MKNRRCLKTIHKKYRTYRSDIWGRLAVKQKYNFMTKLICSFAQIGLRKRSRKLLPQTRKAVLRKFRSTKQLNRMRFTYKLNTIAGHKRKRTPSRRGILLKMRRQISLFYGGGRIRKKTFRRYSKFGIYRWPQIRNETYYPELNRNLYRNIGTFASLVESRLDVLLFRSNFVDTIYQARQYIFHRKCRVEGHTRITHPAFLVKNYQQFGVCKNYAKKLKKSLLTRIRQHSVICIPSYLHVNFSILIAFKIEDPITNTISYPFAEAPAALANFRRAFSIL